MIPRTIFLLIIDPKKLMKTTKCFVDVNKNPLNFRGELLLEVITEKKQSSATDTHNRD